MNKHRLHYLDLRPQPVETAQPSTLALWAGAAFTMLTLWVCTVFLFSL